MHEGLCSTPALHCWPGIAVFLLERSCTRRVCCHAGLGDLAALSDELLLAVLGQLPAQALLRCAAASRPLYCFCYHEELWRALTLDVGSASPASCTSFSVPCASVCMLRRKSPVLEASAS